MTEQKEIKSPKRKIVIPGELLTQENKKTGANTIKENGKIYSSIFGVYYPDSEVINIVPLTGHYNPRQGDTVIGVVVAETYNGYEIDIGTNSNPFVLKDKLRGFFRMHDNIIATIDYVDDIGEAKLRSVRLLKGGTILPFTPVKAPRFIGRNNSMLETLRKHTQATIFLGMNGRIWANNGDINLLKDAIKTIEENAHKPNLTIRIDNMLKGDKK